MRKVLVAIAFFAIFPLLLAQTLNNEQGTAINRTCKARRPKRRNKPEALKTVVKTHSTLLIACTPYKPN